MVYNASMKKRYFLLIFVVLFAASMYGLVATVENSTPTVNTPAAGLSSEQVPPVQKDDLIMVTAPLTGQTVTSPLMISGKARGNWYSEGVFPVELTTDDGSIIASGEAHAEGEWTTTDYVPFTATLTFPTSNPSLRSGATAETSTMGYVVLKKDNPSGDPQFDNSVSIQVQW